MGDPSTRSSSLAGVPAIGDVNRDGVPDVIATFIFAESEHETARRSKAGNAPAVTARNVDIFHRRVVTAISGASGRWLWTYSLDAAFVSDPNESGQRSADFIEGRRGALVLITDGTRWLGLDPETGHPKAGPIELGFVPIRQVQHADLDGDGDPEILAVERGPAAGQNTLHAFSSSSGRELWSEPSVDAHIQFRSDQPTAEFPMIVDLDGDGFSEIVVPDSGTQPSLSGSRGVKLLDGRTGKPRGAMC